MNCTPQTFLDTKRGRKSGMFTGPSINCPWRCHNHMSGWIGENPSCPFHGENRIDLASLSQEEGDRMCAEQEVISQAEELQQEEGY